METFKEQNQQINRLSINLEEAIRNSFECLKATTLCLQHCLSIGGKHGHIKHITLLKECAEICEITASFMMESSSFSDEVGGICARVCDFCSDSCYELDPHDQIILACMTACKNCADSCRNMEHES